MSGPTPPRVAALDVLTRVRRGELADRAFASASTRLEPGQRAWTRELVYGTLRLRGRVDHLLAAFVRGGLDALEPVVLDVLRLGAYQLLEMGSVPAYAAVSQSVELARTAGAGRAAGLVNGVLQNLGRRWRTVAFPAFDDDPAGYLATWGSHPRWLVERWIARWGPDDARALVEANNRRPDLYITPIGVTAAEAVSRCGEAGVPAETVDAFPDSVRLLEPNTVERALDVVAAVVQDPAAATVVRYARVPSGARVVDLAAAPGGKAAALAAVADYVVAADRSAGRMRRVRENVARVGLSDRVGLVVADGRVPPFRPVDLVLLDAPCTGTGTLRRHPDGRWRIGPEDLASLAGLQAELLAAAAEVVRPGGLLVYATCSLEREENDERVDRFLRSDPRFRLEAPRGVLDGTMLTGDLLTVLPQRHGVDGAFAARMRRIE